MAKVSVVIPLYNTDVGYFRQCLDSLNQSSLAKRAELEVIIVNDGSSVDYTEIKKSYPHFHIFSTENKGTLSARLFGLSKASGDYISFVDSDDTVTFDYHEAMLRTAEETSADIVFNDWAFWTDNSKYVCTNDTTINSDFLLEDDAVLSKFFSSCGAEHSYYVLWNKLFRREILLKAKENIERLGLSKLVFAEDALTSYFAFSHAKKIVNTHSGYYFYRIHDNQQIYVSDRDKFLNQVHSMGKVFEIMEAHLGQISRHDELYPMLKKWKELMASSNLITAKHSHFSDMRSVIMDTYSVNKIGRLPASAQKPYEKHLLLPCNLDEIESLLKEICSSKENVKIAVKKHSYIDHRFQDLLKLFPHVITITYDKKDVDIIAPREIHSLKLRILHNPLVYKIGMILVPKGSKIRKLLKSKI